MSAFHSYLRNNSSFLDGTSVLNRAIVTILIFFIGLLATSHWLLGDSGQDDTLQIGSRAIFEVAARTARIPSRPAIDSQRTGHSQTSLVGIENAVVENDIVGSVFRDDQTTVAGATVVLFAIPDDHIRLMDFDVEIAQGSFIADPVIHGSIDLAVALYQGKFKVEDFVHAPTTDDLSGWITRSKSSGFLHVHSTQTDAHGDFAFRDLPLLDEKTHWSVQAGEVGKGISDLRRWDVGAYERISILSVPAMVVTRFSTPEADQYELNVDLTDLIGRAQLDRHIVQINGTQRRDLYFVSSAPAQLKGTIDSAVCSGIELESTRLDPGSVREIDLKSDDRGSLEGQVIDTNGTPIPFARIEASFYGGLADLNEVRVCYSDLNGWFSLKGLRYSTGITLTCRRAHFERCDPIVIKADGVNPIIRMRRQKILRGVVVRGPKDEPLPLTQFGFHLDNSGGATATSWSWVALGPDGRSKNEILSAERTRQAVLDIQSKGLSVSSHAVRSWFEVFGTTVGPKNGFEIQGLGAAGEEITIWSKHNHAIFLTPELALGEIREGIVIRLK